MHLPRFTSHPNGIVLRVLKKKTVIIIVDEIRHLICNKGVIRYCFIEGFSRQTTFHETTFLKKRLPLTELLVERQIDTSAFALSVTKKSLGIVPLKDLVGKSEKIRLPSFISHLAGIVLHVLKRQQSMIETDQRHAGASFICHPDEIVLRVLNQQRSRL